MSKQSSFASRPSLLVSGIVALTLVVAFLNLLPFMAPFLGSFEDGNLVTVYDGNQKPMPHVTLRFRDKNGQVAYVYRTDSQGEFRSRHMDKISTLPVDGFLCSRLLSDSKGKKRYEFSPSVTQEFTVYAADGSRYANQSVQLAGNLTHYSEFYGQQYTDARGQVRLANVPAVSHLQIALGNYGIDSANPAIVSTKRTVKGGKILYEAHIGKGAAIVGKLASSSQNVSFQGYFLVYADPLAETFSLGTTKEFLNPDGDFQILQLPPATYDVSIYTPQQEVIYQRRITVKGGETRSLGTIRLLARTARSH